MTRPIPRQVICSIAAVVFWTGASMAMPAAAEEDTFRFWVDPLILEVLETDVDTDSAKFFEYRDLGSGLRTSLGLYGESADGNRTLSIIGKNLDRDDGRITLDYGLAGHYGVLVDYNRIQHRFGNNATFLWDVSAPGVYEIPDAVQQTFEQAIRDRAANVSPFAVNAGFLRGLIQPLIDGADRVDLGLQRDRTRIQIDLGKTGATQWGLEYRNENRRGNRPYSGAFGFFNVIEIFEPIDYRTRDAEIRGEWAAKKGGLQFGYRNSTFENDISTLVWDNPWFGADSTDSRAYLSPSGLSQNGPSRGFADLAPDNESNTLFLSGRGKFGGNWWANGTLSMVNMTQDDAFLPYTINSAIVGIDYPTGATFDPTVVSTLPALRADNEVDVLNFGGSAGTRFAEDWSLTFRYRYYDYDDASPRLEFPGYVRFHSAWQEVPRVKVQYDHNRENFDGELAWEATDKTKITLAYGMERWDREFRETASTDEDTIKLSIDARPNDRWTLRGSWETGDRSNNGYATEAQEVTFLDPHGINNQPGLRKFTQAAREFDAYQVQAQMFASSAWNCTFGVSAREEDYDESEFGLISDEILGYNFEIGYTPGAHLNFYLFGHTSDRESFQRARQSGGTLSTNPLDDWAVLLAEDTGTYGIGLTSDGDSAWTYDLSAYLSDSDGEADFFTPPGGRDAVGFDNYEDIELLGVSLEADYRLGDRTSLGLRYLYEDYSIDSFNLQGLDNFLPSTLLLVPSFGDYQANVFGVILRFTN